MDDVYDILRKCVPFSVFQFHFCTCVCQDHLFSLKAEMGALQRTVKHSATTTPTPTATTPTRATSSRMGGAPSSNPTPTAATTPAAATSLEWRLALNEITSNLRRVSCTECHSTIFISIYVCIYLCYPPTNRYTDTSPTPTPYRKYPTRLVERRCGTPYAQSWRPWRGNTRYT